MSSQNQPFLTPLPPWNNIVYGRPPTVFPHTRPTSIIFLDPSFKGQWTSERWTSECWCEEIIRTREVLKNRFNMRKYDQSILCPKSLNYHNHFCQTIKAKIIIYCWKTGCIKNIWKLATVEHIFFLMMLFFSFKSQKIELSEKYVF